MPFPCYLIAHHPTNFDYPLESARPFELVRKGARQMSLFDVLKSVVTRELADQLGMMEDDAITWAEAKAARDDPSD